MALWKPFRGKRSGLDSVEKHDGWIYFCTDDGSLFFDYTDADGNLQRKQINAKDCESIAGTSLDELKAFISNQDVAILAESQNDASNKAALVLAESQKYTDNAIANIDIPEGFSGSYNDLTDKPVIPTVPTKVSALENDAGYLTAIPSEYVTETELNDALANVGGGATSWSDLADKPFEETTEGVKTLDEKFIPDTIARVAAIEEVLIEAQTDASNKAAVVLAEAQKSVEELGSRINSLLETKLDISELNTVKQEIITELKAYIDQAILGGEW